MNLVGTESWSAYQEEDEILLLPSLKKIGLPWLKKLFRGILRTSFLD
jgi:hypothetical protein